MWRRDQLERHGELVADLDEEGADWHRNTKPRSGLPKDFVLTCLSYSEIAIALRLGLEIYSGRSDCDIAAAKYEWIRLADIEKLRRFIEEL